MKSAGKARNNGLYRHIRTSKEIIRNLLNDSYKNTRFCGFPCIFSSAYLARKAEICYIMHAEVFMPGAKKMPERDETK